MTIIPMRDLKDTVEVERLCAEENGPVFVTKNGYGRLVVMDIEYYEKVMSKLHEAALISDALSQVENGKAIDGAEVKQRLSAKY